MSTTHGRTDGRRSRRVPARSSSVKIIGKRTGLVWPGDVRTLDDLCRREFEAAEANGVHLLYRPFWRWTEAKERAFLRSLRRRGKRD